MIATVAQLVEQLICNHQVGGSNPFGGSRSDGERFGISEWCQRTLGIESRREVITALSISADEID